MENWGVKNAFQSEEIKEKIKCTNLERYGVEYPSSSPIIRAKIKDTCMERYGVENPSQSLEIHSKKLATSYKSKNYIFESGNTYTVQGYEPFAIDDLIHMGYTENDICLEPNMMPAVWYIGEDSKKHRYIPDIYIFSENKIIEVKSLYTYQKELNKNLLKQQAVIDIGIKFEFWVYGEKGNRI